MTVGMIMAAIAFVCAALVQIQIDVSKKQLISLYTVKCTSVQEFIYFKLTIKDKTNFANISIKKYSWSS